MYDDRDVISDVQSPSATRTLRLSRAIVRSLVVASGAAICTVAAISFLVPVAFQTMFGPRLAKSRAGARVF